MTDEQAMDIVTGIGDGWFVSTLLMCPPRYRAVNEHRKIYGETRNTYAQALADIPAGEISIDTHPESTGQPETEK